MLDSARGNGAITHAWLVVLGGRHSRFGETLACVGYAQAPTLFGIVPVLGAIVGAVWYVVVLVVGVSRVQRTSLLRASIAVVAGPATFVIVALVLRSTVLEAFKIPSGSMSPTLQVQDHIFVNKLVYAARVPLTDRPLFVSPPAYGDVALFESPQRKGEDFIKRVIGLAGDEVSVDDGHPVINGWRVPNCRIGRYAFRDRGESETMSGDLYLEFLGQRSYLTFFEDGRADGQQGPYEVSPDEAFVLGDNRNNSSDSRSWFGGKGGGVRYETFKGRGSLVWLSFDADGKVDSDRMFMDLSGAPRLPKAAPPELRQGLEKCLAARPPLAETTPPR